MPSTGQITRHRVSPFFKAGWKCGGKLTVAIRDPAHGPLLLPPPTEDTPLVGGRSPRWWWWGLRGFSSPLPWGGSPGPAFLPRGATRGVCGGGGGGSGGAKRVPPPLCGGCGGGCIAQARSGGERRSGPYIIRGCLGPCAAQSGDGTGAGEPQLAPPPLLRLLGTGWGGGAVGGTGKPAAGLLGKLGLGTSVCVGASVTVRALTVGEDAGGGGYGAELPAERKVAAPGRALLTALGAAGAGRGGGGEDGRSVCVCPPGRRRACRLSRCTAGGAQESPRPPSAGRTRSLSPVWGQRRRAGTAGSPRLRRTWVRPSWAAPPRQVALRHRRGRLGGCCGRQGVYGGVRSWQGVSLFRGWRREGWPLSQKGAKAREYGGGRGGLHLREAIGVRGSRLAAVRCRGAMPCPYLLCPAFQVPIPRVLLVFFFKCVQPFSKEAKELGNLLGNFSWSLLVF